MTAASRPAPITLRHHEDAAAEVGSTDGRVIYAIGDIHGRYDLARSLLAGIVDDMKRLAGDARPLIVMGGDYVDRGPASADVIAMLLWLERSAPCDVVFLKGNHEAMLLDFVDDPDAARGWLDHGGLETLASYRVDGIDCLDAPGDCGRVRDALLDAMPASHLALLRRLSLYRCCGDYVFVHAGLRPGVALHRQDEEDCLWIRDDFLSAARADGPVVVHGHSWSGDAPIVAPGRIGIDTGAYRTGVLTAARLDGATARFLQACAGPDAGATPVRHDADLARCAA